MSKLTFLEVIQKIEKGEEYESDKFSITLSNDKLRIINKKESHPGTVGYSFDSCVREYTKVQKPVTIEEVLKSDKRCRLEHEGFPWNEYYSFRDILVALVINYSQAGIKEIMQEGKWYLEE